MTAIITNLHQWQSRRQSTPAFDAVRQLDDKVLRHLAESLNEATWMNDDKRWLGKGFEVEVRIHRLFGVRSIHLKIVSVASFELTTDTTLEPIALLVERESRPGKAVGGGRVEMRLIRGGGA